MSKYMGFLEPCWIWNTLFVFILHKMEICDYPLLKVFGKTLNLGWKRANKFTCFSLEQVGYMLKK